MLNLSRRSLVAVVVAASAVAGCQVGPGTGPQVEAAKTWVEHLCNGEYSAAHAMQPVELWASDPDVDADEVLAALEIADQLAAQRLEELRAAGVDVTPVIEVDDAGDAQSILPRVALSGTCYGKPF